MTNIFFFRLHSALIADHSIPSSGVHLWVCVCVQAIAPALSHARNQNGLVNNNTNVQLNGIERKIKIDFCSNSINCFLIDA